MLSDLETVRRAQLLTELQSAEFFDIVRYFTGRVNERERLFEWLENGTGDGFVVTGRAGCGKSAFLGHIGLTADLRIVEALSEVGWELPHAQVRATDGSPFACAINLTGLSVREVAGRIAAAATGQSAEGAADLSPDEALQQVRGRSEPTVFLFDGLDEAVDPESLAQSLLRRLASLDGVRIVVGTRTSLEDGVDLPQPSNQLLVDLLVADLDFEICVLESDSVAVEGYVSARLRNEGSYAEARAAAVATQVASAASQPFLFARLAATEILQRGLDAGKELESLLEGGHRGLFRAALDRLDPNQAAALRALAFAQGRGLPQQGRVWRLAAQALHPRLVITQGDVDSVERSAGDYVATDREHGQATYRLAHRIYVEQVLSAGGEHA